MFIIDRDELSVASRELLEILLPHPRRDSVIGKRYLARGGGSSFFLFYFHKMSYSLYENIGNVTPVKTYFTIRNGKYVIFAKQPGLKDKLIK